MGRSPYYKYSYQQSLHMSEFTWKGFTGDTPIATPPELPPTTPVETPPAEPATPAPTEPTPAATDPSAEIPAPVTEPAPAPALEPTPAPPAFVPPAAQQPAEPAAPVFDIYKELQIGDEHKESFDKLLTAFKNNDLTNYLQVSTVNYDSLGAEQILRLELKKDYPAANDQQLDIMLRRKLERDFNITGMDEETDAEGRQILELHAAKTREALKAEQRSYKIPDITPQPSEFKPDPEVERQTREFMQRVETDPFLLEFERNRQLKLGSGNDQMNFEVDVPLDIRTPLTDATHMYRPFIDASGNFDLQKFVRAQAYAQDPAKVESALITYGKTLGKKEAIDELRNVPQTEPTAPPAATGGMTFKGWTR